MREGLAIVERSVAEREQLLLEAVVWLTKSLREERRRLLQRLAEVEEQLQVLSSKVAGAPPGGTGER